MQIIKKIFSQEDIVGTAYLAASYLEQIGFDKTKLVYVVGSSGITQELDDVGIKYLPIGVNFSLTSPYLPTRQQPQCISVQFSLM